MLAPPLALAGLPMAVYLPVIYADSDGFGLSLAMVGLLIGLSRISDVVTDPLIGYLSDKWKTRWGRRKPWVLVGTPILRFRRPRRIGERLLGPSPVPNQRASPARSSRRRV